MSNSPSRYLPVVLWAGLTAVALLVPGDSIHEVGGWIEIPDWLEPWADKLMHFSLFLVLALLVRRSTQGGRSGPEFGGRPLAGTLLYVVVLEVAQIWIPGRGFEPLDMVAGFAGVLVTYLLSRLRDTQARE